MLQAMIGSPTMVVASGGLWVDADTGELHDKLHVHYRLAEPTQTPQEHERLKRARSLACDLVGGGCHLKAAGAYLQSHRMHRDGPSAIDRSPRKEKLRQR